MERSDIRRRSPMPADVPDDDRPMMIESPPTRPKMVEIARAPFTLRKHWYEIDSDVGE
jgi:hypothetical protein